MSNLKYLEFQRLLKELQFVESDYLYQSELMKVADVEFLKSVNLVLDLFPQLREIYNKNQNSFYENLITANLEVSKIDTLPTKEIKSDVIKKIYRDIVKNTHPDKIKNHKLNDLYMEASDAYEKNDIVILYKVCSELNLMVEVPDGYINEILNKIQEYKDKIKFMESTYTSKWVKTKTDKDRNEIIVDFIRNKIS